MMDPFEAQSITFLDLSDIDEHEREEVLNSLYTENSSVQLPWNVPKHKLARKTELKTDYVPVESEGPESYKIVSPTQHQVYLPSQVKYPAYLPQNHYNSPSTAAVYPATISFPIHQPHYVVYSQIPTTYQSFPLSPIPSANLPNNVTYANNAVYTHTALAAPVPCVNPNYIENDIPYDNNIIPNADNYQETDESSLATGQEPEPVPNEAETPQKDEVVPDKNCNISQGEEETSAVVKQNGETTKNEKSPAPPNKSWASLFSNKTKLANSMNAVNGNSEVQKSSLNEAVNKQNVDSSNNNNGDVEQCPIRHPRKSQFTDPNCYRMGEFLTNHSVDGRTISLQPRGLINRSNYCYINSILQALLACPPVYNLLTGLSEQNTTSQKEKATPVIDAMCRFAKEFQHLPAGQRVNRRNDKNQKKDQGVMVDCDLPFEPSYVYKMLNGIRSDLFLIEGRQEDAEEFLGCVLNGLNDEMMELMKLVKSDLIDDKLDVKSTEHESDKEWQVMGPKNKGSITRQMNIMKTPISNIFGGSLKSRIHRTGDQSTSNIQPFFTLQLNIEKVKTVREALDALVTKNQLEGVTSEKTNEEVEAWQQVTLEELPVILILHLKCFDFKLDGCTKILKALEFPIDLKIDSKLLSSKPVTPREKQYKLFAVVYHDGKEATKGHYVTDAFHVGYSNWIRYDDASVKPVQEELVLKPQGTRVPYLLFYRRSDTIRSK